MSLCKLGLIVMVQRLEKLLTYLTSTLRNIAESVAIRSFLSSAMLLITA